MSSYITDVDLFDVTSSISTPFYILALPEGEEISGKFVYNYYTRNEGISEEVVLDSIDAQSDQYLFVAENWENGYNPRQIGLSFKCDSRYSSFTLDAGTITSAAQNGSIIFEDAPFSDNFTGVLVHDTSIDEKFYTSFEGINDDETSSSASDILNVAKLQSTGYRFSKAQTREEVADLYEVDTKSINLGISINTLFVADLLGTVGRWQASAFVDEFAQALAGASPLQDDRRSNETNPFQITEDEIDISLNAIETKYINFVTSQGVGSLLANSTISGELSSTNKVGYIIEKYGEQLDGSTLRYPDIIIEDPDTTAYTDTSVRYGGVYKYRLRTVYRTYLIAANEDGSLNFSGFNLITLLVASTGTYTTIRCNEYIPPPPPNNISFQQTLSGLYINWNFPINTQKDIKRFQIFRRPNISVPFSLIKELNFDNTILPYESGENIPVERVQYFEGPIKHYTDSEFSNINSDFIYAICSIDAHGFSSGYSEQFRVRFDKITSKLIVSRISTEGAPKPYPNVNVESDFFSDLIKDSGHSRIRVYFDPEYTDVTRSGQSLSLISSINTGEANYKLSMTEINLGQSQTFDIFISESSVNENGIPVSLARFYTAR